MVSCDPETGVSQRLSWSLFRQLAFDIGCDLFRLGGRGKAFDDISLLVDQEFGEVPLDGVAEQAAFFGLQKFVKPMSIAAVDFNL